MTGTPTFDESPETFLRSIGVDPARWGQPDMTSAETMLERLIGLEGLGFTAEQAIAAVQRYPNLIGLTTDKVGSSIAHFLTYGFTRVQITKFIARWASVVNYVPDRIDAVWANLEAYGFSRPQVRKLICNVPAILCYTPERTNGLLTNLEKAGYAREQVIAVVTTMPGVLCMRAERTNAILAAIHGEGLELPAAAATLTRAPYVTRGRIAHLRGRGQGIRTEHLTCSHAEFLERWGLTRDEVIALDPLKERGVDGRSEDDATAPTE